MAKIKWNVITWYSKLLAVFLFFVVLLVGIYIGSELEKLNHPLPISLVHTTQKKEHLASVYQLDNAQNILYANPTYGFTLVLPPAWKDCFITEERRFTPIISQKITTNESLSINFGCSDQNSLVNIAIIPRNLWQELQAQEGPHTETYLGENNQFVFSYSKTQDSINEKMSHRIDEISSIMKTFTLR